MSVKKSIKTRAPRKRFRLLLLALSAVGAILFFLPNLLAWSPVLNIAQDAVNRRVPGAVQVGSCAIGWQKGVRCQGVQYEYPEQGVRLAAASLQSDKGLLALLLAPHYLGEITLDQPAVTVRAGLVQTNEAGLSGVDGGSVRRSPEMAAQPDRIIDPWWERTSFRFRVSNGRVALVQQSGISREMIRELDLQSTLVEGTVNYTLSFQSGASQGHARAEGFVNLPSRSMSMKDMLVSRTGLDIKGLDIAPFLEFAASRTDLPSGSGVLDAAIQVDTAGIENVKVLGETNLTNLHLTGGFLGPDQPSLKTVQFTFNGSRNAKEGWRLSTLDLQSEPVTFKAQGQMESNLVSLTAKGAVHLPFLSAQTPHLLAFSDATALQEGSLDFSLAVTGTPQKAEVKADCRTTQLKLIHGGQPVSWNTPLTLLVDGLYDQGQVSFREVQMDAPFLQATGHGGKDDFTFQASADLEQMSKEMKKLFAFDVTGKGALTANGYSRRAEDGRYSIGALLRVKDLSLQQKGAPLVPAHDFSLNWHAVLPPTLQRQGGFDSFALESRSWPGQFSLEALQAKGGQDPQQTSFETKGKVDIQRLQTLARAFHLPWPRADLEGHCTFAGTGLVEKGRLTLHTLDGTAEGLGIALGEGTLKQSSATFALDSRVAAPGDTVAVRGLVVAEDWQDLAQKNRPELTIDWQQKKMQFRHLALNSDDIAMGVALQWDNWQKPWRNLDFAGSGKIRAALFCSCLQMMGLAPQDMAAQGAFQAELTANAAKEGPLLADLALHSDDFALVQGKKKIYADPALHLTATLAGKGPAQTEVVISSADLQTALFRAEGTGVIKYEGSPQLEFTGQLLPNFAFLSKTLTSAVDQPLVLTGQRPGPFRLSVPLTSSPAPRDIGFHMNLLADQLLYRGLELQKLDIPVDWHKGVWQANLSSDLYGGTLTLRPLWDPGAKRPEIRFPLSSAILAGVQLRPSLVDNLLAPFHPLFGVLTVPEGTIDLQLNQFSKPVQGGNGRSPAFTVVSRLHQLSLKAQDPLKELLDLCGLDAKTLRLNTETITCKGQDGRIVCAPVILMSGDTRIPLSATTGMDGSIDYQLQLPITEQLVGREAYALVRGSTVKASISGTVAAPRFNRKAFVAAVARQVKQAQARASMPLGGHGPVQAVPPDIEDTASSGIDRSAK